MANMTMATSPVHAMQIVNDLTMVNGVQLFGVSILVFIWLIIYHRNKSGEGSKNVMAAASFFTSIIGICFGILDLIPDQLTMTFIALSIISFIPLIVKRS